MSEFVSSVNALRFVLALIAALIAGGTALFFVHSMSTAATVTLFALSAAPLALSPDWFFQGKEDLRPVSASRVLIALMYLMLVLIWVQKSNDVVWTSLAFLCANVVSAAWLLILFRKQGNRFVPRWHVREWRALLSRSLPLGISAFLTQTIMHLPVLIVGATVSLHDAGLFNAALKLVFAAMLLDRVFYAMFLPVISRQRALNEQLFRRTAGLALKIILSVALPVVIGGSYFATTILAVVYGDEFVGAGASFQLLLVYFLFSVVNTVFMCVMIAENREREYLRMLAVATFVLVLLCTALAYTIGINGAAAAVAIGESMLTIFLFSSERKRALNTIVPLLLPSIVAGAAMLGALFISPISSMFLMLPISLVIFVVVFVILKGISKDEVLFLRERFV